MISEEHMDSRAMVSPRADMAVATDSHRDTVNHRDTVSRAAMAAVMRHKSNPRKRAAMLGSTPLEVRPVLLVVQS